MKILAISDSVPEPLYSPKVGSYLQNIDLILGCGDLPYDFLEFLVSSLNVPLYFVSGNHDPEYNENNPLSRADGCENIDRRIVQAKGLSIAGIGGSIRYQIRGANQYTQFQMYFRTLSLFPAAMWSRARTGHRIDILIAHSPPLGIHDEEDVPHRGFAAFLPLMRAVKPRLFLHGHTIMYKSNLEATSTQVGPTTVINVNPYRILEVDRNER